MSESAIDQLRRLARETATFSRSQFSKREEGCVLLLSDGQWIPGVRVESASFPLTLPALLNALTTAVALQRQDVIAIVQNTPFRDEDRCFLRNNADSAFIAMGDDGFVRSGTGTLPSPARRHDPFLREPLPHSPHGGIELARRVARHARVPESGFRVGAIAVTDTGDLIPGVNVEYADWSHILCAERNALGTAVSYGIPGIRTMYLTCACDPTCSPCGACRQLLAELSPEVELWMDRGEQEPQCAQPEQLLPGFFAGRFIPPH